MLRWWEVRFLAELCQFTTCLLLAVKPLVTTLRNGMKCTCSLYISEDVVERVTRFKIRRVSLTQPQQEEGPDINDSSHQLVQVHCGVHPHRVYYILVWQQHITGQESPTKGS